MIDELASGTCPLAAEYVMLEVESYFEGARELNRPPKTCEGGHGWLGYFFPLRCWE